MTASGRRCALVALAVLGSAIRECEGANREYFVRAEEVIWDFGPSGLDLLTGHPFDGHEDADIFMVNRPEKRQIGSRYWKCLYFGYEDGTFTVKKPRPQWMGMLGPTLYGEVGDRLVIMFRNNCTKALTMHPHGVKYTKSFEGAPYWDGNDGRGDHVLPGETYTYLWVADEHAGPGPADGSSVVWPYHSHNPSRVDSNSGLIGAIVISRRGAANAYGRPKDVDREFVLYLSVVDESMSYLLDRNVREFIESKLDAPLADHEREELYENEDFLEGNLMHGINGMLYGNLQGFDMLAGERTRWYVFALGTEADLHFMHWKGHTILSLGQRVSGLQLMAGVSTVADMTPTEAGEWGMYCHTNDHIVGGMISSYVVQGPSVPMLASGRVREHFIQAEEVIWDYGPSGHTLYNTSLGMDDEAATFFESGSGSQRIGGRYWKCVYKAYTDASFSAPATRPARWEHLGLLGPPIHAEVGDSITIVFRNNCTKEASINAPAALKPKEHEGWHYGAAGAPAGSGVVAPGSVHTYEWKVVDGPGPLDATSIAFVYASHAPMHTDTNSGLIGPLIITAFGAANDAGEPLDVEDEFVILMSVFNEGMSYLLDKNMNDFIGNMTTQEMDALKEDEDFQESNLMHGINGYLYGNLVPPQLSAGKKARIYGMAVGTEVDMHSIVISGNPFLIRGERRAQLNLMPGDVLEADLLPTAGTWAVYCQTNDHIAGGMIGRVFVAEGPKDDPMVVQRTSTAATRKFFLQAEEVIWDYGMSHQDMTGQYAYVHGDYQQERGPVAFEDGDGSVFMVNDPEGNRIGRKYTKCIFVGYDSSFAVPEDRSVGSKWQHLGALGPMIHAEEGDAVVIELRNKCTIPVSLHAQIVRTSKEDEGFRYQDTDGNFAVGADDAVVQPNGSRSYTWHINEGPGPRDGSSIGTLYYSMAHGMVADTYTGLKGPLVITRRGFAKADGSPKDIDTEFALVFEVTDEGSSLYLGKNFQQFVQEQRATPLTEEEKEAVFEDEDFQESNLMHGINGLMYANLAGLTVLAETQVRWYLLGLGTEVDMHSVHWHGHTVRFGGHNVDVVMDMPATGITADMYVDSVGKWLLHCHVNDHIEGGMIASYEVVENPVRSEEQISKCHQMYGKAADEKMNEFEYDESFFEGHQFYKELSPYFRIAYSVNYQEMFFDMSIAARTTGWIGLGFYGLEEAKSHGMIDTDMVIAWVKDGVVEVMDHFAQGLETPKQDSTLGGADQLTNKEGHEVNGVTYVKFRRSFKPGDLDGFDYKFGSDLERVKVVFAYSSINSDNLVYHGPTRGYSQIPWNTNCSSNFFWNLGTSECEGCDRGHYRIASDPSFDFTRCRRCSLGTLADARGEDRTTEQCEVCGFDHATTLFPGATSISECVCSAGYFHPCQGEGCLTEGNTRAEMHGRAADFCRPCPSGMSCKGGVEDAGADDLRHAQPVVPYGHYASTEDLTVFKCYDAAGRCPGGAAGTCAEGRLGLQCALCEAGKRAGQGNRCTPCEGADVLPAVLFAIVAVVLLAMCYHFIDSYEPTRTSHSMLLAGIAGGQIFTLIQVMGALSMIAVDWPPPLDWALQFCRVFVFDIHFLHIECVGDVSPLQLFAAKLSLLGIIVMVMCIIHVVFVLSVHKGRFREKSTSLVGALGSVMMLFFISIVSALTSPLQCIKHPGDRWTVRAYPTVVCWESDEHVSMIVLAAIGMLIPITFVSLDIWAVAVYPRKMQKGETRFLKVVGFLIVRFRTDYYWFSLFFLLRNMLLSVYPIFPHVVVQTMLTQLTLIVSLCVTTSLRPWRVWQANSIDNALMIATLVLINLAAFYADGVETSVVAYACIALIIAILGMLPCFLVYGLCTSLLGKQLHTFQFFVCHHKAAAGCFARLLKTQLEEHARQKGKPGRTFIDCDDLTDLDSLFDTVGHQTDSFIVLCSKDILLRPWCVGEIWASHANKLNVFKVIMHDFEFPDDRWIDDYVDHVPDLFVLTSSGITLEYVQETLRWLRECHSMVLPMAPTGDTFASLTRQLSERAKLHQRHQLPEKPDEVPRTDILLVLDHANIEAVATAHVLCSLLKPSFATDPDSMPGILPRGASWPEKSSRMLFICTHGCLERGQMLSLILQVASLEVCHVPILADENFSFPVQGTFLKEHRGLMAVFTEDPEDLEFVIVSIFREICVFFQPKTATEAHLQTSASMVKERIEKLRAGAPSTRVRSFKVRIAVSETSAATRSDRMKRANTELALGQTRSARMRTTDYMSGASSGNSFTPQSWPIGGIN